MAHRSGSRFRHYLNLDAMHGRLERLLADFRWGRMDHVFVDQPGPATAAPTLLAAVSSKADPHAS
jgi:hypothetical protein